jgi:fermentation-respiration switch protein FrsA (DUF1100 family)
MIKSMIVDKWHSRENIRNLKRPVLLIHGQSDKDINSWQSKLLFYECANHGVSADTFWKFRKGKDEMNLNVVVIRNDEGEMWSYEKVRLLLVKYAGHNSLSNFLVVEDAIVDFVSHFKI